MAGLAAGGAAFGLIKSGVIDMNAQLETSTLQFETLMGDADKARKHVEGLFDFAAKTPFETGPIIEASRIMQTFGGDALNTKENLTLFGDAAAGVGGDISEVGMWMSRAYAMIDAGKPFGEARMRLMELGVLTPQVAAEIEAMTEAGASQDEIWNTLKGSLERFGGSMEKQASTWDGMFSTMMDSVKMFLASAAKPLFDGLKVLMGAFTSLLTSDAFNGTMAAIGQALGDAFRILSDVFSAVASALSPVIEAVGYMVDVFQSGDDVVQGFAETFDNLSEKVLEVLQGIIDWVINSGVPMIAEALSAFGVAFIEWIGPAAEALAAALPMIAENILNFLATNLPIIAGKLLEWAGAFIGWIAEHVLPRLPGALLAVAGAILGWIASTAPVVIGRIAEMGIGMLGKIVEFVGQIPGKVGQFLLETAGKIVGAIPSIVAGAVSMGVDFLASIVHYLSELPGKFVQFIMQVVGALPGLAGDLARGALDMGAKFVGGFIDSMAKLPGQIADNIRNAFANLRIDIGPFHITGSGVTIDLPHIEMPHFAAGAWNLPYDMVAQVHKGEMIIPADVAERLRGGRGFGTGQGAGHGGGGGDIFIGPIYIEHFGGGEDEIDRLSRGIGNRVRLELPRRTVTAGAG